VSAEILRNKTGEILNMKKFMALMLGLSLALGSAVPTLAQDDAPKKESKKGKKGKKGEGSGEGDSKKDEKK
jgi:hypothetical protein